MKRKPIQQGDVWIEPVEFIPEGCTEGPTKGEHFILAEGETTGHAHRIHEVAGVEFKEKDGMFYLQNKEELSVVHEEHGPVTIPPGTWKIRKVREYDHFAEEARPVTD